MFSKWSLLLYGTEQPAQPNDARFNVRQPTYKTEGPSIGQSIAQQVS